MFKKIIMVIVGVAVLLTIGGLLLPRVVHVSRSVIIMRPASLVFAVVDGFRLFPKWSPWQALDPNMHQTTEGPREGVGAKLIWSGNAKVGSGTQLITAAVPDQFVDSDLDFGKMGVAKSRITLSPDGGGTRTTWTLDVDMGANPFSHYFGLTMDHLIGPDFAAGLAKLELLLEGMPNQDIAGLDVIPVQLSAVPVLLTSESARPGSVAKAYTDAFERIAKFMAKNKLTSSGPAFSIDAAQSPGTYSFVAGIPVAGIPVAGIPVASNPVARNSAAANSSAGDFAAETTGDVSVDKSYAGNALKTVHVGPYSTMLETHDKLLAFVSAHGFAPSGAAFYRFLDDPSSTPEAQLHTEIFAPVD
jgi:effector-binding domain-containing protein